MDVKRSLKTMDNDFILIEAEELSMDDDFMRYEPKTDEEKDIKEVISEAIEKKVKNFYRPKCDPSLKNDESEIQFALDKKPAVGRSYNWWFETAKKYNPKRNSRIGTRLQYAAFIGVLINKLIEEGKSMEWAWNAVCNDSNELGHYWNSKNAKNEFELTGSRMICGFYDLANTHKILAGDEDSEVLWFAGGGYCFSSDFAPVAAIYSCSNKLTDIDYYGVGWIVLD